MKVFEQINNTTMKVAKGMLAIFMIKVLLFSGVFIFQSCQSDSDELFENTNKTLALDKFKNLIIETTPSVQNIIKRQQLGASQESRNNTNIQTILEEEAKVSLEPLVKGSITLLREYGIEDNDLLENFGTLNNPNIAILGLFTYRNETLRKDNNYAQVKSNSLYDILGTNVYAQSTLDIVDCALTALGLPAGLVIGTAGKLTTKVILKTAAKLAGKAIGWVALAISVYTFARCVDKLPKNDSSAMFFPNNDNKLNLWKQLT